MPRLRFALRASLVSLVVLVAPGARQVGAASLPAGGSATKAARPAQKPPAPAGSKPAVRNAPSRTPTVVLYHVNRRETLRLRFVDERGRPVKGMQRQVDQFLRCHHTNRRYPMSPRLTRLIYETGRRYPGRRIEVVSGYRHPRVAKNPRSPHMRGLAADIRVVGIKNTELRDYFRTRFKSVGVGYYPNSSFVHLDVRRGASAFWIDYSRPGENAQYANNAADDLRSGRADRWRRATIDPSWADQDDVVTQGPTTDQPADAIGGAPGGAPADQAPAE